MESELVNQSCNGKKDKLTSCFSSLGLISRLTVATTKYDTPNLCRTPGILHLVKSRPNIFKKTKVDDSFDNILAITLIWKTNSSIGQ